MLSYYRLSRFRPVSLFRAMADIAADPNVLDQPLTKSAQKKEAKRLEKEAKLAAKPPKASPSDNPKKQKEKKEKGQDVDLSYVETTPKGEKKGTLSLVFSMLTPLTNYYKKIYQSRWQQDTTPLLSSQRGTTGGTLRDFSSQSTGLPLKHLPITMRNYLSSPCLHPM